MDRGVRGVSGNERDRVKPKSASWEAAFVRAMPGNPNDIGPSEEIRGACIRLALIFCVGPPHGMARGLIDGRDGLLSLRHNDPLIADR